MKKFLSFFVVGLLMLTTVTGCFGGKGDVKIGVSISTLNNPFFVELRDGIKEEAEEYGYDVTILDAQDDTASQLDHIDDLIAQKVDIIIINPVDSDAIASAVEAANDAGIPVITVDRSANGGEVVTHIASDNVAGGKLAGEYLLELVGENAKVVELEGIPGASATVDRGEGFHNAVDGKLNVLSNVTANFNRNEGLSVMEDLLEAHPKLVGVFAHNDEMALGAVEALKAAGRDDVIVIGFDATDDAKNAVTEGTMAATVAQQPKLMGTLSIEYAKKILDEEDVEPKVAVDLTLVKK
ncbi:MAG: ribose ABC transporter substrate-binding protein RbsB [Bacilli bacterium]|nr:ribose ABC transporter substrate-binding protein RbsB [Bacilli bacterium]MDD4607897.1 ribose ABC transporter substrate-binding protein RbsB [Bacilli bacterium]